MIALAGGEVAAQAELGLVGQVVLGERWPDRRCRAAAQSGGGWFGLTTQ